MAEYERRKPAASDTEELETCDLHAIPHSDALDNILRYEAAIERELARACERLERLQRRRAGEPVPMPLRVRLSR